MKVKKIVDITVTLKHQGAAFNATAPHITCKTASGAPQVPCTAEFDSCCDGVPGG